MRRSGGLSKVGLDRMHEVMVGHVEHGGVPGLVALVSRRGEVHVDALGTKAAGGEGGAVARDTIFRIASMTKPVTAVAAMILVEECTLRLDDAVDQWLPELADRRVLRSLESQVDETVPAARPITARDLLTFRMGSGMVMAPPGTYPIQASMSALRLGDGPPAPATPPAPDEWMHRFGTVPLLYQPGEQWTYNTSADVLGVLIARASGRPLAAFLRERIFEPLGMKDTGFSVPPEKIDRLTTGYSSNFETGALELYDEAAGGQWSREPAFPSGAGGMVSTADDFAAFGQMMLNGGMLGNERILSRPSVETMTSDQLTPEVKAHSKSNFVPGFFDTNSWGFGMAVITRRDTIDNSVGRYGWDGGLGTSWYSDPSEEMVTILLTQKAWTSPNPPAVRVDFMTSAYAAIDD
jgi:CubicO group peptidase (beta-lactamase class C family)